MKLQGGWLDADESRAVTGMLEAGGHQAWFVGGCVRNALLDEPVSDLDIATEARPERVMELAEAAGLKAVPTGIEHGTVTVVAGHHPFEITTFRRDVETDGRRAVVAFSDSLEEDAARRDFTMNALYADPRGELRDPVGGLADLAARRVRFIGDAVERIEEDRLRILRFFRFHAWYGDPQGGVDAEGLAACAEHVDGIEDLSRERVGAEMKKLLSAPDPAPAVAAMSATGVLGRVLPGADGMVLAPLVHIEGAAGMAPDAMRRLAALGGEGVAERLRLSKAEARRLERLAAARDGAAGPGELGYRLGAGEGAEAVVLRALATTFAPPPVEVLETVREGAGQVFPLRAKDLMPAFQGKALGDRLAELERAWIESGFTLSRERLLALGEKQG